MKPRSNSNIEQSFNEIDRTFNRIGQQNKQELDNALIKPIHEKYPFAQNGICAMIASMGSGKSFN